MAIRLAIRLVVSLVDRKFRRIGRPSDPSGPDRTRGPLHFYAAAAAARGRWETVKEAGAARVMSVFPTKAAVEIEIRLR